MIKNLTKPRISMQNPRQMWFVLVAVCLVNFMFNFYIGMMNICLPNITEYFGASVMTATWISNIYLVTLTISVIFLGRIGGLWSRKKFFILGTLIWIAMSFANYFVTSADMLILFRAIQGVAAGFMAAVYYAILDKTFPKEKLGLAMGCLLVALSSGYAIGPFVGGYIAAFIGWQSIFLATIPFGLLSIAVYLITAQNPTADKDYELIEKMEKKNRIQKKNGIIKTLKNLDVRGAILQALFLFLLTFVLILAQKFGFSPLDTIILAVTFILGGVFIWVEAKHEEPLFRFTIFRSITFSAYITGLLLNYIVLYMMFFTMPFYLQKVVGVPVNISGSLISITMFTAMFLSIIAGALADKIGVKPLALGASLCCIIATVMISAFNTSTGLFFVIGALIAMGFGYGLYQSPNNKMLLSVTPASFKTQVSSMMTLTKNLGSVLGNCFAGLIITTSIAQNTLNSKLVLQGVQATNFMTGMERVFIFGAILSIMLLVSTLDLQKYFPQRAITKDTKQQARS